MPHFPPRGQSGGLRHARKVLYSLAMKKSEAIKAIEKHGILLVYPIAGKKDPASLWSVAYPKSEMRWEWDEDGDDRVARLWHVRSELSTSRKVIYSKWFQGRATFFSIPVFRALLRLQDKKPVLSRDARELLSILEERSPLSTKVLKKESGLVGRALESTYHRALKELWNRFLIVAYGEVDDGAFPSLAVGATSQLFEDLYRARDEISREEAEATLRPILEKSPALEKFFRRQNPTSSAFLTP